MVGETAGAVDSMVRSVLSSLLQYATVAAVGENNSVQRLLAAVIPNANPSGFAKSLVWSTGMQSSLIVGG